MFLLLCCKRLWNDNWICLSPTVHFDVRVQGLLFLLRNFINCSVSDRWRQQITCNLPKLISCSEMSGDTTGHLSHSGSDSLLRLSRKITLPRDVVASDPNSRDKATRQYAGPLFLLVGQNRNRQEVGAEARTFVRRDTSCIKQTGIVFLIVHYSESGAGLKPALCNMSKSAVQGELLKVIAKPEIAISLIHLTLFCPWRKLCWHPLIWITSGIHATCSVMLVDLAHKHGQTTGRVSQKARQCFVQEFFCCCCSLFDECML